MPHLLQMFYGNLSQLDKKSNSVLRSRSETSSQGGGNVQSMEGVTAYGYPPECHDDVIFGRRGLHIYCLIRSPYQPLRSVRDDFKRTLTYPCPTSLLESSTALRTKLSLEEQALAYRNYEL